MPGSCSPPKTVRVRDYVRGKGRKKRKPAPPSSYYTCKQDGTGRTCGMHHKTLASAVRHTGTMDRRERMDRAKLTRAQTKASKLKRWHAVKVG